MLTKTKATSQAASRVRRLMPGVLVTADTRESYDLSAGKSLMITSITYPPRTSAAIDARAALMRMPGVRTVEINGETGYMTVVREA